MWVVTVLVATSLCVVQYQAQDTWRDTSGNVRCTWNDIYHGQCTWDDLNKERFRWEDLNLPVGHIPYYFYNNPRVREECRRDNTCPYKAATEEEKCWGYEADCPMESRMLYPRCFLNDKKINHWLKAYDAKSPEELFWKQGDFGYLKAELDDMIEYCQPQHPEDSSLRCSNHLKFCRATNLYIDLRHHAFRANTVYNESIFNVGEIGGHCELDQDALRGQDGHKHALSSWFGEMEQYTSLDFRPLHDDNCDVVVHKPTILMKLDSGGNMYHHFCDFLNLYITQHGINDFSQDVKIIIWNTSKMRYGDLFKKTWEAFTNHPLEHLHDYQNKRVCFKKAVFPLLARMHSGLYYSTFLIPGCKGTALFRAFQEHVAHRLKLKQEGPRKDRVRVTLLSRGTRHRRIINEAEIVEALDNVDEYEFKVVNFNSSMPFEEQLQRSINSDIFMGIHGAGLTHLLFQPDWAAIFEIYNCGDAPCYKELARLRGVEYFTWETTDQLIQWEEPEATRRHGAFKKFTNYTMDVPEVLRIVGKMAEFVNQHQAFKSVRIEKYGPNIGKSEL